MMTVSLLVLAGAIGLGVSVNSSTQNDQEARDLTPDAPIERELKRGEAHIYQVALEAGQFLQVTVEQKGIDVALKAVGPDSQLIDDVNRVGDTREMEGISVVGEVSGPYRLEVRYPGTSDVMRYPVEEAQVLFNLSRMGRDRGRLREALEVAV
jgi:hypothetical protein